MEVWTGQVACSAGYVQDLLHTLSVLMGALGLGQVEDSTPSSDFAGGNPEESYDTLEFADFTHHPRYMRGQVFVNSAMTALAANTAHNPSLDLLFMALLQTPMVLFPLPVGWPSRKYGDFCIWLLRSQNLIAVGLYRSSQDSAFVRADHSEATYNYFYTAPPGDETFLARGDSVLCLTPRNY